MNESRCRPANSHGRWPAKWLLVAGAMCVAAQSALAHWPASPRASVDVYDRTSGTVLAVYEKDGRRTLVIDGRSERDVRVNLRLHPAR